MNEKQVTSFFLCRSVAEVGQWLPVAYTKSTWHSTYEENLSQAKHKTGQQYSGLC